MNKNTIAVPIETYNALLTQLRSCRNLMQDDHSEDVNCGCDWCRVIKETTTLLKSLNAN